MEEVHEFWQNLRQINSASAKANRTRFDSTEANRLANMCMEICQIITPVELAGSSHSGENLQQYMCSFRKDEMRSGGEE